MKKTLFAVLAACSLLSAESYQINTLSAKQLGMAHTGAGIKLGSESMHFNPGALGFLDKTLDISAGATFIMPEVEFHGIQGKAVNEKMGTPLYVYVASSITDWFSAGLSFTTPYGNSADYGKNWEGSELLQDISLAVYALQPTVAFKVRDDISIGVGPAIYFGSFEQSKALPLGGYRAFGDGLIQNGQSYNMPQLVQYGNIVNNTIDKYDNTTIVSAKFSGDADVAVAANIGILYDLIPNKLALGVAYRSEAKMKVAKGKVKVGDIEKSAKDDIDLLNQIITGVNSLTNSEVPNFPPPTLDGDNFTAELPLPANLNTGISFRPTEKLLLAFDWQIVFWGEYEELTLDFNNLGKQVSQKKYHNTDAYRLGAQYTIIDQLDVRLGVYYDETPVDDDYLTPESPSTNKLGTTIGFSFRPIPNLSIDASFLYSNGSGDLGRDATSGSNPDKAGDGLDGRYEVQALVPSVGVSFKF
jgi:long-chain fatty acid transport protein